MKIFLDKVGKRYNYEWVFKAISFQFHSGTSYAILGANGSGKSTLLQIIAGNLSPSEGKVNYTLHEKKIEVENIFRSTGFSAPYLELIEEFSLEEMISFHEKFKPFSPVLSKNKVMEILGMEKSKGKMLKNFSSGMKQRVKLALAILSDVPVVLLDEPATNLDEQGVSWYKNLVNDFSKERLLIVCSNQLQEYDFCKEQLNLHDFKG